MAANELPTPAVAGYRPLSDDEVALVNEIKALGEQIDALQRRVVEHVQHADSAASWSQATDLAAGHSTRYADALRSAALAKTEFQAGCMWLVRAVAQPDGFA